MTRRWKELKPSTVFINTSVASCSVFQVLSRCNSVLGSNGSFWKDRISPSLEHQWEWWARRNLWKEKEERGSLEVEAGWAKGHKAGSTARPQRTARTGIPRSLHGSCLRVGKAQKDAVSRIKGMQTCAARRQWAYFHLSESPKPWLYSKCKFCTKTYL